MTLKQINMFCAENDLVPTVYLLLNFTSLFKTAKCTCACTCNVWIMLVLHHYVYVPSFLLHSLAIESKNELNMCQ